MYPLILVAALAGLAQTDANLIRNGSFAVQEAGRALEWEYGQGELTTQEDSWVLQSSGPISQSGVPAIEPRTWYRVRVSLKGHGIPSGRAILALRVADEHALMLSVQVDGTWTEVDKIFYVENASGTGIFTIDGGSVGTLYVRDVSMQRIDEPVFEYEHTLPHTDAKNLVPNASFEAGPTGWLTLSERTSWGPGLSGLYATLVEGDAAHGRRSMRIDLGPGISELTTFNMFPVEAKVQHRPLLANVGWIPVEPGRPYTLSAIMKSSVTGVPVTLLVRYASPMGGHWDIANDTYKVYPFPAYPRYQHLTTDWKRYSFTMVPKEPYAFVAVGADMSSMPDTVASVWVDAVQFESGQLVTPFGLRAPVEVGAHTDVFGNVFDRGADTTLHLTASNGGDSGATVNAQVRVLDFFDTPVSEHDLTLRLDAESGTSQSIDLGLEQTGYYTIQVAWSGDVNTSTKLRAAVIDPYTDRDAIFGINHAPPTDLLCEQLRRIGHVWARDWSVNWQHLEPEPGKLSFGILDPHVKRVLDTGMQLMCQLPTFPSSDWASEAPQEAEQRWQPHSRIWWRMAYAPKDMEAFAQFVGTVVNRYKDRVHAWEYLNEPLGHYITLPTGAPSFANYTVDDYIRLLKVQYEAAKAADPRALMIGGLGAEPLSLKEFIEKDGLDYVDVANIHIYPGHRRPEYFIEGMKDIQRWMSAKGRIKSMWMTECAYSASDTLPYQPYALGPMEWQPELLRDEKELAAYSVRFITIMLAHGVEKIFYHYGGASAADVNDGIEILQSPLLAHAGTPRKLYPAHNVLAHVLGSEPQAAGELDWAGDGIVNRPFAYSFATDAGAVAVVWAVSDDGNTPFTLQLPEGAAARNIMGNPIDEAEIGIGETPIYLVSDSLTAEELMDAIEASLAREAADAGA